MRNKKNTVREGGGANLNELLKVHERERGELSHAHTRTRARTAHLHVVSHGGNYNGGQLICT